MKFKLLEVVKPRMKTYDFVFVGTVNKAAGNKNHSKHIKESSLWRSTCKFLFTYVGMYITQRLSVLSC